MSLPKTLYHQITAVLHFCFKTLINQPPFAIDHLSTYTWLVLQLLECIGPFLPQ